MTYSHFFTVEEYPNYELDYIEYNLKPNESYFQLYGNKFVDKLKDKTFASLEMTVFNDGNISIHKFNNHVRMIQSICPVEEFLTEISFLKYCGKILLKSVLLKYYILLNIESKYNIFVYPLQINNKHPENLITYYKSLSFNFDDVYNEIMCTTLEKILDALKNNNFIPMTSE
jgi:hypothetical protein